VARRKAQPANAAQLDRRLRHGHPIEPEIAPNGQPFRYAYDASLLQQMARGGQSASLASGITQRIERNANIKSLFEKPMKKKI
jgi:hypothetical protein